MFGARSVAAVPAQRPAAPATRWLPAMTLPPWASRSAREGRAASLAPTHAGMPARGPVAGSFDQVGLRRGASMGLAFL